MEQLQHFKIRRLINAKENETDWFQFKNDIKVLQVAEMLRTFVTENYLP